jgi:hypothetical protein
MPSKLHMTVPTDFRRSSAIPEILVLHRAHLEVRALCCREIGEPVDFAVLSNPVSRVHVVRMHLFGEPRLDGLFGCEKALLRLGYFEGLLVASL